MPEKTGVEERLCGRPTILMCPQCNSLVYEYADGDGIRFRCQLGHEYGADELCPGAEEHLRHAWANVVRTLALIP